MTASPLPHHTTTGKVQPIHEGPDARDTRDSHTTFTASQCADSTVLCQGHMTDEEGVLRHYPQGDYYNSRI
jgi:hypothetical protein